MQFNNTFLNTGHDVKENIFFSSKSPISITPSGTTAKKIFDFQWTGGKSYNTFIEDTVGPKAMTSQDGSVNYLLSP